ncbi:hypothetical protein NUACC21_14620 [Scytonema sp. NUACC21]
MKSLIIGGLSLLAISTAHVPALWASETEATTAYNPAVSGNTQSYAKIKPFNLVILAYQGYFQDQGIPSYNDLITAYKEKQITAEDLVRGAVKSKKLPAQVLSDKGYLNAVAAELSTFRSYY